MDTGEFRVVFAHILQHFSLYVCTSYHSKQHNGGTQILSANSDIRLEFPSQRSPNLNAVAMGLCAGAARRLAASSKATLRQG